MPMIISYSVRNVFKRRLTSILTIAGVALVVFVFCAVMMLSHGLEATLAETGHSDNAIIVRRSSGTEIQSIIPLELGNIVKTDPAIALEADGAPRIAGELLVLISQPKRSNDEPSNIPVRGVGEMSMKVRPDVKIVQGRMYQPGGSEVIAGAKCAKNFKGCGVGETVRFGAREWTVVGVFEANGSGFESEIWGDYDQMADAWERRIYSSLTARLASPADFDAMKTRLQADSRLTVEVKREQEYYRDQSNFTRSYINVLGTIISVIFSFGAIIGAMITMYGSVANRTAEIGTMRALGFSRWTILSAFLFEAVFISLVGGAIGIAGASFLRFYEVSTTNWDSFAELAFNFRISPDIIIAAVLFAVVMGIIGGFLPAVRAARMDILTALRSK